MASMNGDYDLWSYLQVAWWMVCGLIAFRSLVGNRRLLIEMTRLARGVVAGTLIWLGALSLSVLVSPYLFFSAANVFMLGVLVICAADACLKLYSGAVTIRRVLKSLLAITALLLAAIILLHLIRPGYVEAASDEGRFGLRIRGGRIGYSPLLSLVALFVGFYFWRTTRGPVRFLHLGIMTLGMVLLYLGQTRSAYAGFLAGAVLFGFQWSGLHRHALRLTVSAVTVFAVLSAGVLLADMSDSVGVGLRAAQQRLLRGEDQIWTLTGRTYAFAMLWEASKNKPLGLGFAAGPRLVLQRPDNIRRLHTNVYGNAHNAYFEIFSGGGYIALLGWIALIICLLWSMFRAGPLEMIPFHALLVAVLLEGIAESELVLPFKQTSALFWIVAAAITAVHLRRIRARRGAQQTTDGLPYRTTAEQNLPLHSAKLLGAEQSLYPYA